MSGYQPEFREVRCNVLLASQWIDATFTVPKLRNFREHLETLHEFEPLSDVRFAGSEHHEPFLDVHRSAIRLVIPPESECLPQVPTPAGGDVEREVLMLVEGGHLRGSLAMKEGIRVSDFFRGRQGFAALADCRFVPHDLSTEAGASKPWPHVVVNTAAVLAVSESHPSVR